MRFLWGPRAVVPFAALLAIGALSVAQADDDGHGEQSDRPIQIAAGAKLQRISGAEAAKAVNAAKTSGGGSAKVSGGSATFGIPVYSYSVTSSRNGSHYTGQIVGANPAGGGLTTVPTYLIPVKLVFQYSSTTKYVFDPMGSDAGCLGSSTALALTQNSPIFQNYPFSLTGSGDDNTQYSDHFNRANFWTQVTNQTGFRTLLGTITEPEQTVALTASNGFLSNASVFSASGQCGSNTGNTNLPGYLGVVNINTWDPIAQSLIKTLGIPNNAFPVFLFYNAVLSQGRASNLNNCCILGYHNAVGSPVQTYAVAEFEGRNQTLFTGVADVSTLSHEINEWMQDPGGNNATPAWGGIGQVSGCQSNYEVGDPLSGKLLPAITSNGFTYHLQELAYFSWFFGGPSVAVNGGYSNGGTFTGAAKTCPPGGSN